MTAYEKSLLALEELFGRDFTFVLATAKDGVPSQRVVDTFLNDGVFWIVTYANTNKVREIAQNPHVSLCSDFYSFKGTARCAGHPLQEGNREIRSKLIRVFEPWYFAHNDENDEDMCYIKVLPETGFFHKDGMGYRVDFIAKEAEAFPFSPQIEMTH